MNGKVTDDFIVFSNIWKELVTTSSSIILALDFHKIVQIYGDDLMLPGLANMSATMRDAGAVTLAVTSEQTKLRDAFLRIADCYLKIETIDDTIVIYGVKPFTNVHGVEFSFDKGYPSLRLTEIVLGAILYNTPRTTDSTNTRDLRSTRYHAASLGADDLLSLRL